jgi:hypothetical protein
MNDGRHRPVWQDDNDDDGDAPAPQMAQLARTASVELGIGRTSSATVATGSSRKAAGLLPMQPGAVHIFMERARLDRAAPRPRRILE